MGSLDNFHRAIVQRVESGELLLGVDGSFASNSKSVAFSKFWTLVSFFAVAAVLGILWQVSAPWWGYLAGPVAAFLAGSMIGLMRARAGPKTGDQGCACV